MSYLVNRIMNCIKIIFLVTFHMKYSMPLPHCTDPSVRLEPCQNNDTYCGDWDIKQRKYYPNNCYYRDFTGEQARKCIGNRTIGCIGDSIMRDHCIGLAMILSDEKIEDGLEIKFDHKAELTSHFTNATKLDNLQHWTVKKSNYAGLLFPKVEHQKVDWTWQIQIWELYCNYYLHEGRVNDILNNKQMLEIPGLHKLDFAFWSHGLHDYGWWDHLPYGERFYEQMPGQWIKIRHLVDTPTVWMSMNPQHRSGTKYDFQKAMVEDANYVTRKRLREAKLPYWDSAACMRSPQRANLTADGVHVKMWVDLVRAKMLLNHLCDENYNWVDSAACMRSPQCTNLTADGVHVKMWVDLERVKMLLNHLCDENYNWIVSIFKI